MSIEFPCSCGKTLRAPDGSEGRTARCPRCSNIATVPSASRGPDLDLDLELAPRPVSPPSVTYAARATVRAPAYAPASPYLKMPVHASAFARVRQFAYLLLLLALLPLVFSTFHKEVELGQRIVQTIEAHPEVPDLDDRLSAMIDADGALKVPLDEFLAAMPGDRLEGALFPRATHAHWLIALFTAAGFFAFLLIALPNAFRMTGGILFAGFFTGTVGIVLLLGFQFAAYGMPWVTPRGVVGLIILIVKLIGLSYSLADGDTNFFLSFIGFTCGVGLCEEATKAIPILFRIKPTPGKEDPTWNNLLVWGFASGAGFGIAEGIMYSGRSYNGIEGAEIYYVRFLSCVALHAMWAGAVAIAIYRNIPGFASAHGGWAYCFELVKCMIVPMILHGLYDTLLKKDMNVLALAVAGASFGWLVYEVESIRRTEPLYA